MGLNYALTPPIACRPPLNHTYDSIVAVHGLNPLFKDGSRHAYGTWTTGNVCWLTDFLPKRLPTARVFIYEYDSKAIRFEDLRSSEIIRQARGLLHQLHRRRMTDPQRPLLFLAHSLGGLLIKTVRLTTRPRDVKTNRHGPRSLGTRHREAHRDVS